MIPDYFNKTYLIERTSNRIKREKMEKTEGNKENNKEFWDKSNKNGISLSELRKQNEVFKPNYYKSKSGQDALDVIENFNLDFCLGNAIKYIIRAGKKSDKTIEDLNKAKEYIDRKINYLSQEVNDKTNRS